MTSARYTIRIIASLLTFFSAEVIQHFLYVSQFELEDRKHALILGLSHRTNETLVNVYEVYGIKNGQKYLQGQDDWIGLYSHKVPVLKYVRKHQELQENGSP